MTNFESYKQQAAEHALQYIQSGMVVGLGSGSTASYLVRALAAQLRGGHLRDIVGIPTSEATAALAGQLGIPLSTLDEHPQIDIALDGADEIDPALQLIKGLGGALLREKIVAASARRFVVLGDESKLVARLGSRAPVPVELVAFGLPFCSRRLSELGGAPALRRAPDGSPFRTDEGHIILDCRFSSIPDPAALNAALNAIPGVMEHGLFVGMATLAVVAGAGGITRLVRPE